MRITTIGLTEPIRHVVEERIDVLLIEALDSGEPITVTNEYWEEKKRKLNERFGLTVGQP